MEHLGDIITQKISKKKRPLVNLKPTHEHHKPWKTHGKQSKTTMLMWTEASKLRTLEADSKVGLWRYQLKKRCLARVEDAVDFTLFLWLRIRLRSIWSQTCLPLTRCSEASICHVLNGGWLILDKSYALGPSIMSLSVSKKHSKLNEKKHWIIKIKGALWHQKSFRTSPACSWLKDFTTWVQSCSAGDHKTVGPMPFCSHTT